MSLSESGKVVLELRHRWRDGTTHIRFEPLVFIERLAALVPPPGVHQTTFHGVLAGGSSLRDEVIPVKGRLESTKRRNRRKADGAGPKDAQLSRYSWAELMRRVFGVDVLACPRCKGRCKVIALIHQPDVIVAILECLGLESSRPAISPARAPPQLEFEFA